MAHREIGRDDNPLRAILERDNDDDHESKCQVPVSDFCLFLPWACNQLEVPAQVVITAEQQHEYVPLAKNHKKTLKAKKSKTVETTLEDATPTSGPNKDIPPPSDDELVMSADEYTVHIKAIYSGEDLVVIHFINNKSIPRQIFKLIEIIACFYVRLYGIIIDSGMDQYTAHELTHILSTNRTITEIILDNCFVPEANYHILLDNAPSLKYLSLARCRLEDEGVKFIAAKLKPPLPASKSLRILNLSSNKITNAGANYLAEALRFNRCLSYLSLASNLLTDQGAEAILNILKPFRLTISEYILLKTKYVQFLRYKYSIIQKLMTDFKEGNVDPFVPNATDRGKTKQPAAKTKVKTAREKTDDNYFQKAAKIATDICGEFDDPIATDCTVIDNFKYSNGNNTLTYLNLAYNGLSYCILHKLLNVLKFQRDLDRKPRGLVNVQVEGNPLPEECLELFEIDEILRSGLGNPQHAAGPGGVPGKKKMMPRKSITSDFL